MSRLTLSLFVCVPGLLLAQAQVSRPNSDQMEQRFEQHLTERLGLSASQVSVVHAARVEARTNSQSLNEQMRSLHTQLNAAVKAGDEGQIDAISSNIATIHQQQTSINAKATAKIYAALTADQKTKVGDHLEMLEGGGGGRGFGGPGGPGFGPRGRGN